MKKIKSIEKVIFKSKFILLTLGILLFSQSTFAQSDCEKLFFKAMQDIQTHVKTKGLSSEAADAYILKSNNELKAKHPDCFPEDHVEEARTNPALTKSGAMKVDSKNLKDEQIQEMDAKYTKASADCKLELKKNLVNLSKEQATQVIHECALEKVVASM